jgi:inosine/xanthosine triphosphate pyrophosphatase family protein
MSQRRLFAGTRNPAKVAELAEVLRGTAHVMAPPPDLAPPEAEGDGTFAAIAAAKALAWSRALREREPDALVAASDGGVLIPALGERWNLLHTRRFAGIDADDRSRADALLALADDLHDAERRIAWRESLAIARNGALLATFAAESPPGILARDYDPALIESGRGFWIPALWACPECGGKRLAELTAGERAGREDHWTVLGRAVRAFLETVDG